MILKEVKLDDVNTEMGKANKSVKMWTQILFKLSGSMFLSGKNEEESQCPACKINTLQLYWNHTSAKVFSCKFAAYFWRTFY